MALRALRILVVFCSVILICTCVAHSAEAPAPQPLEWNVFLSNWSVLGPFPKPDKSNGGTHAQFVEREAELRPGPLVEYQGKTYLWRVWDKPVILFRDALQVQGAAGDNVVAYAWTEFHSPLAQKAVLAIGHDDSVAAWLNGKEVHRNDAALTASYLDQATVEVDLREGTNALLLKIGQGSQGWEAAARLRPTGSDKALVSFGSVRSAAGDLSRAPVLQVDLLDAQGGTIRALRTSGYRNLTPQGLRFAAYGPVPETPPARVRVRYAGDGLKPLDRTFAWAAAASGTIKLALDADQPAAGRALDLSTGKPILHAQFWNGENQAPGTTDATGRFAIENISPLATNLWIAAAGYEARYLRLPWPRNANQTFRLKAGGHVLKGRVLSQDGRPLAGARIDIGLYSGYTPHGLTDSEGRFEIVSIPSDRKQLYPVISCADHVTKDRFGLDLKSNGVTEVEWKLVPGVVITGRVTAKTDGSPIAGVTITTGFDRFGSNTQNPSTKSDAEGRYRLGGVAVGQVIVHAFSDQHAPAMTKLAADLSHPAEVNFEVEPGQSAMGRVTDPQGNPVRDVWLVTDTWNGVRMFRRETRTDADGRFRLEHMPATSALVHVIKKDYVSKRDLMVKAGEQYEVTLSPVIEHTVRVRLADSQQPAADLKFQKGYRWSGRPEISWQSETYDREGSYDKSTGVFKIRMDETYDAEISYRFRLAGYRDAIVTLLKKDSQPASYDVVLEPVAAFRGRVFAADTGQPLEGIIVALVSKQDKLYSHLVRFTHPAEAIKEFTGAYTVTKSDGSFSLPKPENPAATGMALTRKGGGFIYLSDTSAWLAADRVEIPYPQHGSIEGTVTVAGRPAAGEILRIEWRPLDGTDSWDSPFGVGGEVTTDAGGHYQFAGLGPGRYHVCRVRSFSSPTGGGLGMHLTGEEVILLPGQKLVHDLAQAAGHAVAGQTIDPRGMPLGDCIVTASRPPGEKGIRERIDAVRADSEGRFAFHNLPAGQLEFSADHYSVTDGQRCGLGGQDFGGQSEARIDGDTKLTIRLDSRLGGVAAREGSLAGSLPPDFNGKPLDAKQEFKLSEQWGKVVAIDFWATWCGPCMAVMPEMKKLHEKYKDSEEVVFITVSLDNDEDQLRTILKKKGLEFPVLFSGQGWNDAIAKSFGVTGIPNSFVIGRDGRFASDSVHGSKLAEAVEAALKQPRDPAYASGKKPARLTIKTKLDDTATGIPGAKIRLQALDASGRLVREDDIAMPGLADQIVWLYPQLDQGGRIKASVRGEGLAQQQQTLDALSAQEELTFIFASPRIVEGRVTAGETKTPAPGVKVTLHGSQGFQRSSVSGEDGAFRIGMLPGKYSVSLEGTDKFAPLSQRTNTIVVPTDSDLDSIDAEVCRAVTVKGTVVGGDGAPVAGAKVRSRLGVNTATTNDKGEFELTGVASVGRTTIYASKDKTSGAIPLEDYDGSASPRIVLGQGLEASKGLHRGAHAPPLTAWTLDGEKTDWRPSGDRNCLVVFCALGHPAGRDFLAQARFWAQQHEARCDAFSIDWSLEEARRKIADLGQETPVLFAGPGGLAIAKEWSLAPPAKAYLLSPEGKILGNPAMGTLP